MKPQTRGDLTEAAVLHKLMSEGYTVSQPFDDNQRYDFIIDDNGNLERIQVKTARYDDGCVIFDCANSVANTVKTSKKTYTPDEIDAFIVYSPDIDEFYRIDVEDANKSSMRLQVSDDISKFISEDRINWASDYSI